MKYGFIFIALLLFFSCNKKTGISKHLNCETTEFKNLEKVEDVKNLFSVDFPKNWKINLYQDEIQSSIFAADTTKQLTETILLDVTFINQKINLDESFLLKQEQENLVNNLIKIKTKEFIFLEKPSIYMIYRGKKGKFSYQICTIFIQINEENSMLAKTEIYGDIHINNRFCSAFSLLENIKLNQE
ncbi:MULTISPECIES: hypothetical protein [unclassified Polaribacter]|uniref:hypothetical protein n=1 Tax=unclassified Polaribacter TaxID=196858 RepID=UPI0011BEBB94|nr:MULTISPECIES: hypothetical protein [unclassified Polaribacter]TXD51767.1 hypothetical protein ES043_10660 [Polaribacter sp. IC063]TXD58978.1 hypothetical protein ES044_11230 [Polaribacter sp. IC066]